MLGVAVALLGFAVAHKVLKEGERLVVHSLLTRLTKSGTRLLECRASLERDTEQGEYPRGDAKVSRPFQCSELSSKELQHTLALFSR